MIENDPTTATNFDESLALQGDQLGAGQNGGAVQDDRPVLYTSSTQWDIEQSPIIKGILKNDYNQYESETDRTRTIVMNELNEIIRNWIKDCGMLMGKDEEQVKTWGGKIFEFGSYRLDVHSPGTDIDALCVAPCYIDRDDHFFGVLPEILQQNM